VRKLPAVAIAGLAAAALAGTAIAANPKAHRMDVPLPGGGVVHVDYVGDVAPKVTVAPAKGDGLWAPMAFPGFGNFDAMLQQKDRQMQQMQQMARQPNARPGMNIAAYGNMPEGSRSMTVVSTSNGGVTCTRSTEIVSQGVGKAPKVTSNVSGDCGDGAAPQAAPRPIDRT
jgi:hypothetical protein